MRKCTTAWQCAILHLAQDGRRRTGPILRHSAAGSKPADTEPSGGSDIQQASTTTNDGLRPTIPTARKPAVPGPRLSDYFGQACSNAGGGDKGVKAGPLPHILPTTRRPQHTAPLISNGKSLPGQATEQSYLGAGHATTQDGDGSGIVSGAGSETGAYLSGRHTGKEDSRAGVARPSNGVEVSTMERDTQVSRRGHRSEAFDGPGSGGIVAQADPGIEGRHGSSLSRHPEAGGHHRDQHHIPPGPLHSYSSGSRGMDGFASIARQCSSSTGGRGLQEGDSPPEPDRQADQGRSTNVLRLVLGNNTNCCYMNSFVQAMLWSLHVTRTDDVSMGRARSFFASLRTAPVPCTKHLMRDMTWRMLMSGWAESHRQHDVAEFAAFFIQKHNVTMPQGSWNARLYQDGAVQICDVGHCTQPITLRMPHTPPGLSPIIQVQSLVDYWSGAPTSDTIQALAQTPQLLLLQIDRFEIDCGRINKRLDGVEVNRLLVMPVFSDGALGIQTARYQLIAFIKHHGIHPQAGHYTTTLLHQNQCWQCDDNREAQYKPDIPSSTVPSRNKHIFCSIADLMCALSAGFSTCSPNPPPGGPTVDRCAQS